MKIESERLQQIQPYIHSTLSKMAEEQKMRTGKPIINLGPGIPDIRPSEKYIKKLQEFFNDSESFLYPGYRPIPGLSNALISWYKRRFNVALETSELLHIAGGKDLISHLPLALWEEGDEILIPDPGYPGFVNPICLASATPVSYRLSEDISDIKKKITKNTKAIFVNSPSNPTGHRLSREFIVDLVKLALKNEILIIYDNAYSEIYFDEDKPISILEIKDAKKVAIELGSFSKTFSFAGLRLGWVVGNSEVIQKFFKLKTQIDSGVSLSIQKIGAFTLDNFDSDWHKNALETYKERRDKVTTLLLDLGLAFEIPNAGLYIWAKIPDEFSDSMSFCEFLLKEKNILATPGIAFGENSDRFIRASFSMNI